MVPAYSAGEDRDGLGLVPRADCREKEPSLILKPKETVQASFSGLFCSVTTTVDQLDERTGRGQAKGWRIASTAAGKEGTAKSAASEQLRQAIESTSSLLHLMQQSSPSQKRLAKLPRNLLEKTSTIKNTGQVLHQMPRIISSIDANLENALHSAPHLKPVIQLLENMEEICHTSTDSQACICKESMIQSSGGAS